MTRPLQVECQQAIENHVLVHIGGDFGRPPALGIPRRSIFAIAIEVAAKEEGIGFPTVRKAKKRLGIVSLKELNQWYWLPAVDRSVTVA